MKKIKNILILLMLILCLLTVVGCSDVKEVLSEEDYFSEEAFLSELALQVEHKSTEFFFYCRADETLEQKIDSALEKAYNQYLIGNNVENITWNIRTLIDAEISFEIEYKETFEDKRSEAIAYDPESFFRLILDSVLTKNDIRVLLINDGTLTSEFLEDAINQATFDSGSAIINYYLSSTQYSIATFSDYAAITVNFQYTPDTVAYESLSVPADMRHAAELLDEQWDTSDTAYLYYPHGTGIDSAELCDQLIATGVSNDVDDPYLCDLCEWTVYGEKDNLLVLRKLYDSYNMQTLQQQREELLQEARSIANELTSENEKDKIKELGKLLAGRIQYDHEIANKITADAELTHEENIARTAYGALIGGKTVCSGYAKAFKLICDTVGIDCWIVDGEANEEGHEWNAVFLDGKIYYVDVTFADTGRMKKFYLFDEKVLEKEGYVIDENFYVPTVPAA